MLNAVLGFACVLVALLVAFYFPVPLTASTAAGGILWWLFSGYRNVLESRKMSGSSMKLNLSRSGLLDGCSPRPYPSCDGDAVYSPKGDRRYKGALFDRSSEFFSTEEEIHRRSVRNSIFSPSGHLNQSSGRLNDSSSFLGSPVSARNSFRVSINPRNETPVTSPSVSIMSRSWSMDNKPYNSENRASSPELPPGSYPWIMPHGGPTREKMAIGTVPVKIRVSKPTSSFVVPVPEVSNEQHPNADASKQIIQALKAMSRKRMHTTESDESVDDSAGVNMPKRRPMEFYHNLYTSHLGGSSESSLHSLPETPEDSMEHRANGVENHSASPAHILSSSGQQHNMNNQQQLLSNATTLSNKRPRPAHDSGNQTAKKRNNNEIMCSLSSSLAILDPKLLQGSRKRKEGEKNALLKRQKLRETSCAGVQTLPSPIFEDDQSKDKEDKGTATDNVNDDTTQERSRRRTVVVERKVTENMAKALLQSAKIKLASSGEFITPDTSLTSHLGSGDTPVSKDNGLISVATIEAPKVAGFTFGATPTTTSSDKTDAAQTGSLTKLGTPSTTVDATATKTTAATLVAPTAATQSSAQPSAQPSGFTLAGFPKPPTSNGLFKFGTDAAPKEDASKNEPKPTESVPVGKPDFAFGASKPGGFSFGATTTAATVPVSSVAPSTISSTPGFTLGQSAPTASAAANTFVQSSQPASTAPTVFGLGSKPATTTATITFGQTQPASTAAITQGQAAATVTFGTASKPSTIGTTFGQSSQSPSSFGQNTQPTTASGFSLGSATPVATANTQSATSSKPGGFSFTPAISFSMGSSPTSSTASTSLAPIFSFGSSGFGQKQDVAKTAGATRMSLFGMPPLPATSAQTSTTPQPAKSFGGFHFTPSAAKEPEKPLFPSATPQNPEQKKTDGFSISGFGNNPGQPKPFSFGPGTNSAGPANPSGTSFQFTGASANTAPPPFGSVTSPAMFSSPAATSSSPFGSTSTPATATGFGSTTPKTTLGFGTPTTAAPSFGTPSGGFGTPLTFGSVATTAPAFGAPSTAQTSAFGAATTQASGFGTATTQASGFGTSTTQSVFGSTATPSVGFGAPTSTAAPTFGSTTSAFGAPSAPSFGSTAPTFGSATSTFGSSTMGFGSGSASTFGGLSQATFGSVASSGSTSTVPFGSSPATTTASQFGSGGFGASAFGASTAPPTFGATPSSTPAAGATFGTQTTSATAAPFSFTAPTPATGGFNFQAPQPSAPSNMFQFGTAGSAPPQAGGQQPFTFGGAPPAAPGGFQNTMFSIGSGSSAPRTRTTLRTRKK